MKTGMEVVKIAQELGFEIRVLTKGPNDVPYAWAEKLEWCQEHLGKDTQVTITRDKSTVYGRVLVDDYWLFMKGWLENKKHGLGLIPGDSDNKDVPHPNVTYYDGRNLDEVKELLIRAWDREDNEPF